MGRSSVYVYIFCIILLFLIVLFSSVSANTEQPGPINMPFVPVNPSSDQIPSAQREEKAFNPFSLMIKLYKKYLSPVNSSRCTMYPSCSSFASRALRYHGGRGMVMTFDRLLRCGRDLEEYTLVFKTGRILHYDPVIQLFELNTDESPK